MSDKGDMRSMSCRPRIAPANGRRSAKREAAHSASSEAAMPNATGASPSNSTEFGLLPVLRRNATPSGSATVTYVAAEAPGAPSRPLRTHYPFSLPHIDTLRTDFVSLDHPFIGVVEFLFGPSPVLRGIMSALHAYLMTNAPSRCDTYAEMVTLFSYMVATLPAYQASSLPLLLTHHGRIGDPANSPEICAFEYGEFEPKDPYVEARLNLVMTAYEVRFPDLNFVTFVDGRSRYDIVLELDKLVGCDSSHLGAINVTPLAPFSKQWYKELHRCLNAVFRIAIDRIERYAPRDS